MKYKNLLLFLIFIVACSKKERIEEIYQQCVYNSLEDKGKSLKRYTREYETYLIKKGVLKNKSPQSYYNILKAISEGKKYNTESYTYSYADSLNKNREERLKTFPINQECAKKVIKLKNLDLKEINKLNVVFLNKSLPSNDFIKEYLKHLDVKDFKYDYYKQRVFILMDLTRY